MRKSTVPRFVTFAFLTFMLCKANAQSIFTKAGSGNPGDYTLATSAYLNSPASIAIDAGGNLYIADAQNNRIRKVSATTGVITTVAGNGTKGFSGDGGQATLGSLDRPQAIALDANGNLYISDTYNQRIRKVSAATGIITTIAGNGTAGFSGDGGPATAASLNAPQSIAFDAEGNLYIADPGNQRIRKIITATGVISTVVGNGAAGFSGDDGQATAAALNIPLGVALDNNDNLYIADAQNNRIRKVSATTGVITTVAGGSTSVLSGDGGPATLARLNFPLSVTIDGNNNIYILDDGLFVIRKVTAATGVISTVAGNGTGFSGDGGPATAASLFWPKGLALDADGNMYIADAGNQCIRRVAAATGIISTVVGNGTGSTSDGGPATEAWLYTASGIAVNTGGDIYVNDGNQRIRKITASTGVITTVAGNGTAGFSGDGGPATAAALNFPRGLAVDIDGNIFFADFSNQRIRKVSAATGIITTVAGNGTAGFSGDGGPATAASLNGPRSIAFDTEGNLYIADFSNQRIRKVSAATGIITTVAGNGTAGFSGDGGPATAAALNFPWGLAVDIDGNIFFADAYNNRVRKVTVATGVISTVVGNGISDFGGDGGPATSASLAYPHGITIDASGNIYIGDANNNRIRRVDAVTGIIATVAGNGIEGFSGDGGPATGASLAFPTDVAIDARGNLYIGDASNHRIRYVCAIPSLASSTKFDVRTIYPEQNAAVFESNCTIEAKVQPSGVNPVTGVITDSIWVEPTVPVASGQPYVQRHYGITPSQNGSTATATITLYFTQADFTAYNAVPNHGPDLPADAADAANNKANVRIIKRSGTSNNGTGLFDTYSSTTIGITPTSVVWDSNLNAWAVTFDVEGFSGFFVTSAAIVLPVKLVDFTVRLQNTDGSLMWQTADEESLSAYEVERSANGRNFAKVGSVKALGHAASNQYSFTDQNIASQGLPIVYYRLRIVNNDGAYTFSKVIPLTIGSRQPIVKLYPNPAKETATLSIVASQAESVRYVIMDAFGRTIVEKTFYMNAGLNSLPIATKSLSSGMYTLLIRGRSTAKEIKFVKQ